MPDVGAKIAEDVNEKFWKEVKDRCETTITNATREIEINKHIIKLAIKNLERFK